MKMKKITQTELNEILASHKIWTDSNGVEEAKADLNNVDLRGTNLTGADLSCADLSGADLTGADLTGADLNGADLNGADLSGADLSGADLTGVALSGANLTGATLRGATLKGATLKGADFNGANIDYSCLPLWCGSLKVNFDDAQAIQLLYHTLSIMQNSNKVSEELKQTLLIESNVKAANAFHQVGHYEVKLLTVKN